MSAAAQHRPEPPPQDPAWMWIRTRLERDRRLLRTLTQAFVEELMAVEVDARCWGADGERINRRNGYRHALFEMSYGSISVRVPKLRQGGYAPAWLSHRSDRADEALIESLYRGYVDGMSGELVATLVAALDVDGLSPEDDSTVADAMNARIDALITRPLLDVHGDDVVIETRPPRDGGGAMGVASTSVNGELDIVGFVVDEPDAATAAEQLQQDLIARGLRGEVRSSDEPTDRSGRQRAVAIVVRRHGRGSVESADEPDAEHRRHSRRVPLLLAAVAVLALIAAVVVGSSAAERLRPDPARSPATTISTTTSSAPVNGAAPSTVVAAPVIPSTAPPATTLSSVDCTTAAVKPRVPLMDQVLCEAGTGVG